jgi:hypothetical protein
MDKKPFRIRFDSPVELLDAGHAARDWIFVANHSDKSLLRNYGAYFMAGLMEGMTYAPYARIADVYFNGEYQGVYMISVQLNEVREGRVDLAFHDDPGRSEFLVELNRRVHYDPANIEGVHFFSMHGYGRFYHIRWPGELPAAHIDYLRDYLDKVDALITRRDPHVFRYICMDSFVDFYLVQEIFKNYDVSSLSIFMQLRGEGENRRLEKGPVWDFDISAGNCYYQNRDGTQGGYSPQGIWAGYINSWFRYLIQIPDFRFEVARRMDFVNAYALPQTLAHIEYTATKYQASFERNFARWPIMGMYIWPNPQGVVEIDTFMGQVDYLVDYLTQRAAWLTNEFGRW